MVREQIQNYVNLMIGLRRATRAKALEAAQGLLSATGLDDVAADAGDRVSTLAEEIMAASRANRELLVTMINTEIDKAAAKAGFARSEEVEAIRAELAELRSAVADQVTRAATAQAAATEATVVAAAAAAAVEEAAASPAPEPATGTRAPATTRTSAKRTPAAKSTASKTSTKATRATKKAPTASSSATRKTAAKKASATPAAKRTAVKQAPAASE